MPFYQAPGVYIEEISSGPRPIEAVGTSIAGFVGVAPARGKHPHELQWFDNWTQFLSVFVEKDSPSTDLAQAVYGFFQNGGSRCAVVNIGSDISIQSDAGQRKGLDLFEEADEIAIVAAPGFDDVETHEALLTHCEALKDRVAVLDGPDKAVKIDLLTKVATPPPAEAEKAPPGKPEDLGLRPRQSPGGYGAFYFPWLRVRNPLATSPKDRLISVPPSGHIAGIYARVDGTRGVHKAPANEVVRGALDITYRITRQEQEILNPAGVNCIRFFPNEGIRVFGARTVAEGSSEWRYLNVRRLFNMIEESIAKSTRWIVFEPNDRPLWKSIRRDVSAFLTLIWRQGALMGRTPEEAFFVKCDEETNPPEEIDAGRVVAVIGVAPVKPAEFVIFRIGQGIGGAEIEVE